MTIKTTNIPQRQKCVSKEHPYIGGAADIFDDALNKPQEQVNADILEEIGADDESGSIKGRVKDLEDQVGEGGTVDERIAAAVAPKANSADVYLKTETYNKSELNDMITTPNQEYVTLVAESGDTLSDIFDGITGAADTTYRVGNWDGSANSGAGGYDITTYSEYAYNGTNFVHLSTKTQIGEVFDISAYYATGGVLAKYADLTAALGTNGANIPEAIRKGGMSVKFVHTSDNKYVLYRYMGTSTATADFTNVANWQGVDDKVKAGSKNLIENGAVAEVQADVNANSMELSNVPIIGIADTELYNWHFYPIHIKLGLRYIIKNKNVAATFFMCNIPNPQDESRVTIVEGLSANSNFTFEASEERMYFGAYIKNNGEFELSLDRQSIEEEMQVLPNSVSYLNEFTTDCIELTTEDINVEISDKPNYGWIRYSCNIKKGKNYIIKNYGDAAISMKTVNSFNPDGTYTPINTRDGIDVNVNYIFTASDNARFILIFAKTGCKFKIHSENNISDSIDSINNVIKTDLLKRKLINTATNPSYVWSFYNLNLKLYKGETYKITLLDSPAVSFGYSVNGDITNRVELFSISSVGSSKMFVAPEDAYLGTYQKSPSSWSFEHIAKVNYTEKGRAKAVINNAVSQFDAVKCPNKDVYVSLLGDSITAYQSSNVSAIEGVTRVPAVCDRQAVANGIWEAFKYGNVQYRRFDDGKASLVGDYSDLWSDDSEAFFVENGDFYTQYERNAIERAQLHIAVTTKIDNGHFSEKFDSSEDTIQSQRNIPKRFSNSANASVMFTIPAGYSKFDFIFHANVLGDSVTITTNRENGIVKYNRKPNDWNNGIEANSAIIDLSMEPYIIQGGGNDAIGNPNMRIHFNISDTTSSTTVTITKSADTSKYLIYQGIAFWGTADEPYGLHINTMAIGGVLTNHMYQLRDSVIRATNPTAIVLECCLNDQSYYTISNAETNINSVLTNFKTYFESLSFPISDISLWIPHISGSGYNNYERTHWITKTFSRIARNLDFHVYLELYKILEACRDVYQPELSMYDFMMQYRNGQEAAIHLNYYGYQYFAGAFESL